MTVADLVVESSLRGVPILAGALLLQRVVAKGRPESRGGILLAALLALWSVPVAQRALPDVPIPGVGGTGSPGVKVAASIWLLGASALLARVGWNLAALHRHVGRAAAAGRVIPIPGRRTRVVVSDRIATPLAAGLVRPVVLLPPEWRRWSRDVRRGVLAHEFAHLGNADPWRRLLGELTRAVHWPNPLVWWVVRLAHRVSEEEADRAAVRSGIGATDWADALLHMARRSPPPAPASSLASGLTTRIEALVAGSRWSGACGTPARVRRPFGPLAVVVLLLVLAALPEPHAASSASGAALAERWGIERDLAERVMTAAETEGVEPALAFALIQVESGFDARRVSPSGAVGYTQILPATAAALEPGVDPGRLHEEELNLRLGLRHFRALQARFPDHPERAILAYGEGVRAAAARRDPLEAPYVRAVLRAAGIRRS